MFTNPSQHKISSHTFLPIVTLETCEALPPGYSYPDHRRPSPQSLLVNTPAPKNYPRKNDCIDNPSHNPDSSSTSLVHYGYAEEPADPHAPGPRPAPHRS